MALGHAILPCLETADLTEPRLALVELCASAGNGGGTLAGLHEVARLLPDLIQKVAGDLRHAVARGDIHDVEGASQSIADWAKVTGSGRYPPIPEALKDALIAALEVGVRPALQPRIWCARHLLQSGALSTLQIEALLGLLPGLCEGLAYEKMPQQGPEAIGILRRLPLQAMQFMAASPTQRTTLYPK
jgi:hypothetical protein